MGCKCFSKVTRTLVSLHFNNLRKVSLRVNFLKGLELEFEFLNSFGSRRSSRLELEIEGEWKMLGENAKRRQVSPFD